MVTALVLSGGVGTRLGKSIPKQYLKVNGKPIICYCLEVFQNNPQISHIAIVADSSWQEQIKKWIEANGIDKFVSFADAGKSRQHSILNGLREIKRIGGKNDDLVIIHDAARPCVTMSIIDNCISLLEDFDCSMPVITVKDTVYLSEDGRKIEALLNRDHVFAGQAPEGCHLGSYLHINEVLSDDQLEKVRGTSAIAFEYGLTVGMFPGEETNYKITTKEDLEKFKLEMEGML